jgi:uncharacterized protein (UPF0332 family)
MLKMDFLTKLKKQGKLELVDSSENLKDSYILKSESNLSSAKILFRENKLEESVVLAYYSMYNILISLFFKVGIKSENHMASIILLKDLFNLDNSEIRKAKSERVDKQYYVDFEISKNEVGETIKSAESFFDYILDFVSKLTNKDIQEFRKRFKNL